MSSLRALFRPLSKALVHLAVLLIDFYRLALSGFLGSRCRFSPTCSVYAREAYMSHGFFKGTLLSARRISRCHPFGGSGYDPVEKNERLLVGSEN